MVSTLSQVVTATLAAEAGGAIGIAIDSRSKARLHHMVWVAAGAMLSVTCFDMLPESFSSLGLKWFTVAALLGFGLIAVMARISPSVCPACDIGHNEESTLPNVWLIAGALAIHCALDGIGFVAADRLDAGRDLGLLIGLSVHKLPEGLALTLLLLGGGLKKEAAFAWTLATETFTLVGAGLMLMFGARIPVATVAGLVAFVGAGFLYLVLRTLIDGLKTRHREGRRTRLISAACAFAATAAVILITR